MLSILNMKKRATLPFFLILKSNFESVGILEEEKQFQLSIFSEEFKLEFNIQVT